MPTNTVYPWKPGLVVPHWLRGEPTEMTFTGTVDEDDFEPEDEDLSKFLQSDR